MPQPVYVSSLFALLAHLGYEQQYIAAHLGVSKTATSLWATGKRPLSDRHAQAFFDFVDKVLRESELKTNQKEISSQYIWSYVHMWSIEMNAKVLEYKEKIRSSLKVIHSYDSGLDPLRLTASARSRLRKASLALTQHLDYLDHLVIPEGLREIIDSVCTEVLD